MIFAYMRMLSLKSLIHRLRSGVWGEGRIFLGRVNKETVMEGWRGVDENKRIKQREERYGEIERNS